MDSFFSSFYGLTLREVEPLVFAFDVLFRSALIVFVFRWWVDKMRPSSSPGVIYIALLGLLACIATLPFLSSIPARYLGQDVLASLIIVLVPGYSFESSIQSGKELSLVSAVIRGYAAGVLAGFVVLALSMRRLPKLRNDADFNIGEESRLLLESAMPSLGVRRNVALGISSGVESPVSFGWRRPTILVPNAWLNWDHALRLSILKHELTHIQRADWATAMLANVMVCLSWYNPFAWYVRKQIAIEAEYACDAMVLENGTCRYDYAEHLLWVAKSIKLAAPSQSVANPMVVITNLTERVSRVLSDRISEGRHNSIRSLSTLVVFSALLILVFTKFASAQDASLYKDPRLLYAPNPVYPAFHARQGLRGYAHLKYDVDVHGRVDPESIRVVNSTDSGLFSTPAIEAVKHFKYEPRLVNGKPKPAKGMEWTLYVRGHVASFVSK